MCTTSTGLEILTNVIGITNEVSNKVAEYKTQKAVSDYKQQIALNNARLMQNEAMNQKQLGIEKVREEKIEGIQNANRQKAINAASNFDINSETSIYNFEDIIDLSNTRSKEIENIYTKNSENYQNKANSYINSAKQEYEKTKNNLFKFAMQGLGKTNKIATNWLNDDL